MAQKMATTDPLEELLASKVDESAISALVGSLETQLGSPTSKDPPHPHSVASVHSNHVDDARVRDGISTHTGVHTQAGQKPGLIPSNSQITMNTVNGSKDSVSQARLLNLNSVVTTSMNLPNSTTSVSLVPNVNCNTNSLSSTVGGVPHTHNVGSPTVKFTTISNASTEANTHSGPNSSRPSIVTIGSTNTGTITVPGQVSLADRMQQPQQNSVTTGSAIHDLARVAAEQAPLSVPNTNMKTQVISAGGRITVREQLELQQKDKSASPSNVNMTIGNATNFSEAQFVVKDPNQVISKPTSTPHINIVTSAIRTTALTPASTSVITITKPAQNPASISVVRPVSAASSHIQIVNSAPRMTAPTPQKIAPRIVGPPIRIAAAPQQTPQQVVTSLPRPQGNGGATITLPPGLHLPPGTVLMKNEHGQLMFVSGQQGTSLPQQQQQQQQQPQQQQQATVNTSNVNSSAPTYKIQSVPRQTAPTTVTVAGGPPPLTPSVASNPAHQPRPPTPIVSTQPVIRHHAPVAVSSAAAPPQLVGARPVISTVTPSPMTTTTLPGSTPQTGVVNRHPFVGGASVQTTAAHSAQPTSQAAPTTANSSLVDNVRKCKNFLSTLIKLASNQPPDTVKNVRNLIQGLIDGKIEPERFTSQLQIELKSSPQPYLIPFLKKSLPPLRQALVQKQMSIEGVRAPPNSLFVQPANAQQPAVGVVTAGGVTPQQRVATQQPRPVTPAQIVQSQQAIGAKAPLPSTVAAIRQLTPQQAVAQRRNIVVPPNQTKNLLVKPQIVPQAMVPAPSVIRGATPVTPAAQPREKRKYEALKDDDDFNDVATMGGVNLSEESRNILATNSELMSGQMRSCKDESFLNTQPLQARINTIVRRHGLDEVSNEVTSLLSHATQERLRNILEKLSVYAEHRLEVYKGEPKYEVAGEVRPQLRFIEELEKLEKKRHEEAEREVLLRAAKSRSKHEDPEQLKLKEKAKALQQAEMEELRQREANLTALAAIGPRKKKKLDDPQTSTSSGSGSASGSSSAVRSSIQRQRIKRVTLRDLIFLMEQEPETSKSNILYRAYLK